MNKLHWVTALALILCIMVGCQDKEAAAPLDANKNILLQGASIHGANGIIFDSEDKLHVASVIGREILVVDTGTGEVLKKIGVDQGVEGPDDLIFGPDGSLYWTAITTGEVGRLSPDGVKTSQMVKPGVNPITFSDDGRLFVGLCFYGDALYELDPDLIKPPRLIAENLGFLNGFDFGPDGFLYGPIWTKGQVAKVNVESGSVTPVIDGLGLPAAVKFDSQKRLHVVDNQNGNVLRIDINTGNTQVIATVKPDLDNLAFNSKDQLFISNAGDGSIHEILANGKTRTVKKGGMIYPGGVAVMAQPEDGESVFVADFWSLREIDGLTGEEVGFVEDEVARPLTVSPDGENLILSSWIMGNTVQVWNPKKQKIIENFHGFAIPLNAIRFQDDLIVAELGAEEGAGRIVRVNKKERVTIADGFSVPAGIATDGDNLWISDFSVGKIFQIAVDGKLLQEPITIVENLSFPEGLAVDIDGTLLVVETGMKRLLRIDTHPNPPVTSIVAEGLDIYSGAIPGMPPTLTFNGVAVGPSGTIYVTGDEGSLLYHFKYDR
jgi:sugar lactone lactonase YvrE